LRVGPARPGINRGMIGDGCPAQSEKRVSPSVQTMVLKRLRYELRCPPWTIRQMRPEGRALSSNGDGSWNRTKSLVRVGPVRPGSARVCARRFEGQAGR
jgi:hypothetical protein